MVIVCSWNRINGLALHQKRSGKYCIFPSLIGRRRDAGEVILGEFGRWGEEFLKVNRDVLKMYKRAECRGGDGGAESISWEWRTS